MRAPALVFGIPTRLVTIEATRALVDALHDVRYLETGHDPVTTGDGLDELVTEIAEFLSGSRAIAATLTVARRGDVHGPRRFDRARSELGDGQWRDLLASFRLTVRASSTATRAGR